jgi:hypothetical protein
MTDITVTAADVRPLPDAIIEEYDAGGSGSVGDLVYMATDGDVEESDASAAGTTYAIGVVVAVGGGIGGRTTFVAGDRLAVVVWGRVTGFSGMTPGDMLYVSNTAATLGDAAGDNSHKMGRARSATVVFIQPELTEA